MTRPAARVLAVVAALVAVMVGCSTGGGGGGGDAGGGDGATTTTTAAATTTERERSTSTTGTTGTTAAVDPGAEAAYVDSVAVAIADEEAGDFPVTPEEARCLAPKWVEAVGFRKLVEAGVTPEALGRGDGADSSPEIDRLIGRPQSRAMVEAFAECGLDIQQVFVEAIAADSGLSAAQQACMVDELPQSFVEEVLELSLADGAGALGDDPVLADQLRAAVTACP